MFPRNILQQKLVWFSLDNDLPQFLRHQLYRWVGCFHPVEQELCVDPVRQIVYLVNTKVASRSILLAMAQKEQLFAQDDGQGNRAYDHDRTTATMRANFDAHKDLEKCSYLCPISQAPDYISASEFTWFSFVRQPLQRALSFYLNKLTNNDYAKNQELIWAQSPSAEMIGWLRRDAMMTRKLLEVSVENPRDLQEHRQRFALMLERLDRLPPNHLEKHYCEQNHLLKTPRDRQLDFIGKFESLDKDMTQLKKICGLELFAYANPSAPNVQSSPQSNQATDWLDYYTIESAERVMKRFSEDIRIYGYEDDCLKALSQIK